MFDNPAMWVLAQGGFGEPPLPIWHLPVSVGLFGASLFLLYQGAAFLKWVTRDEKDAPDPRAGITLAWGLTAGILLFFYLRWYEAPSTQKAASAGAELALWLITLAIGLVVFPFRDPEAFSQALLFASLPVGTFAVFKFVMAAALARSSQSSSASARSPMAVLVGGICALIQIAGSIASLYALFR